MTFEQELTRLINKHSKDNESDTPDFLLAEYLNECLEKYNRAIIKREAFYGRTPKKYSNHNLS